MKPALVLHAEHATSDEDDVRVLRVVEQTYRKFASFTASNGVRIKSVAKPQFSVNTLFVRGSYGSGDTHPFVVSLADYERIKLAVREYNEMHATPDPVVELPPDIEVVK